MINRPNSRGQLTDLHDKCIPRSRYAHHPQSAPWNMWMIPLSGCDQPKLRFVAAYEVTPPGRAKMSDQNDCTEALLQSYLLRPSNIRMVFH